MAGPFYFAWVGGAIIPAFSLQTKADIWSGSLSTIGDVWANTLVITADTVKGTTELKNFSQINGLRIGKVYQVKASGVPSGATITYNGGYSATLSIASTTTGSGVSVELTNTAESTIITNLDDLDGLISGETYNIESDALDFGTNFVHAGTDTITINQPALKTAVGASLTITKSTGRKALSNIADLTGLVDGEVYSVATVGLPGGETFTYNAADGVNQTLYMDATENGTQIDIVISKGISEDDGGAFDASIHNVYDETILNLRISQQEGQFASAIVEVVNPFTGLLSPTRKRWVWISVDNGSGIQPLFHGRIKGSLKDINKQRVSMEFTARPRDFAQQKSILAAAMRNLPYVDPVFVSADKIDDPDTVLETRNLLWDSDRVTHVVSTTDVIEGEYGTLVILASDGLYGSVDVTYGDIPKRQITVSAIVTWPQRATGTVDITDKVYKAFVAAGSPYASPNVGSLTSDGLLSTWPAAGSDGGGGWAMAEDAIATDAGAHIQTVSYTKRFTAIDNSKSSDSVTVSASIAADSTSVTGIATSTSSDTSTKSTNDLIAGKKYNISGSGIPKDATITLGGITSGTLDTPATATHTDVSLTLTPYLTTAASSGSTTGYKTYDILFDIIPINQFFNLRYTASRERSEIVQFTLNSDIQSIMSDDEGTDIKVINLTSDLIDKDVDLDGSMPIVDPARNAYFATSRGKQSIEFLLYMAAAELRLSARAVNVKVRLNFFKLISINCRKNITLHDPRLPGGQATGKVIAYTLSYAGRTGMMYGEATFGCTIGNGTVLTVADGTDVYASGYAVGYTGKAGKTNVLIDGTLHYKSIDGTYVIDDDGVDLLHGMTPDKVVKSINITGGPDDQKAALDAAASIAVQSTDVVDALKNLGTNIEVILTPVDGGGFRTKYFVKPDVLALPKLIDLEAA